MKEYKKLSMEVVEIENTDIVTDSGATEPAENPAYATNYSGVGPGFPGHGGNGNADATCCN